jgi:hypothetical protein
MIDFETARQIVADDRAPNWPMRYGTFMVADYGLEDDQAWAPSWGAKEWIEGGDPEFVIMDQPLLLVDKQSGAITNLDWRDGLNRIDAMREVGNIPQ